MLRRFQAGQHEGKSRSWHLEQQHRSIPRVFRSAPRGAAWAGNSCGHRDGLPGFGISWPMRRGDGSLFPSAPSFILCFLRSRCFSPFPPVRPKRLQINTLGLNPLETDLLLWVGTANEQHCEHSPPPHSVRSLNQVTLIQAGMGKRATHEFEASLRDGDQNAEPQ